MKRILFITIILLAVVLSACSTKEEAVETASLPKWEYYTYEARCSIDWNTTRLICSPSGSDDQTTVSNIIYTRSVDNWELIDIISSHEPSGGDLLTFVFKREIIPVTEVEE